MAVATLSKINDARLARSLCSQLREKLRLSHEAFTAALDGLEAQHRRRLQELEKAGKVLRKQHVPRIASATLRMIAMRDRYMHGKCLALAAVTFFCFLGILALLWLVLGSLDCGDGAA